MFGSDGVYGRSRNLTDAQEHYVRSPGFRRDVRALHQHTELWFDNWLRHWYIVMRTPDRLYEVRAGHYDHFYRWMMITDPRKTLEDARLSMRFTKEDFRESENEDKRDLVRGERKRENANKDLWSEVRTGPQVQVPGELNGNP